MCISFEHQAWKGPGLKPRVLVFDFQRADQFHHRGHRAAELQPDLKLKARNPKSKGNGKKQKAKRALESPIPICRFSAASLKQLLALGIATPHPNARGQDDNSASIV
jgi:hypothetical protein